jgi:hypothetical protein
MYSSNNPTIEKEQRMGPVLIAAHLIFTKAKIECNKEPDT